MKTYAGLAFFFSTLLFITKVVADEDFRMRAEGRKMGTPISRLRSTGRVKP